MLVFSNKPINISFRLVFKAKRYFASINYDQYIKKPRK